MADNLSGGADEQFLLPCPLQVGGVRFGKGVKVSTAQGAIDRLWANYQRLLDTYEPRQKVTIDELRRALGVED